jgi:hypothetical protein
MANHKLTAKQINAPATLIMDRLIARSKLPRLRNGVPKAQKTCDITRAHKLYLLRNVDRVDLFKQSILFDCLATAKAVSAHLTDEKLKASSGAQLANIRRESTYTAQMLKDGLIPTAGDKTINVMQIIMEQPVLSSPQTEQHECDDVKEALIIEPESDPETEKK